MIKIAIHGLAGSGKTTLANIIKNVYTDQGKSVHIQPLAKPLKDLLSDLLDIEESFFEVQSLKNTVVGRYGKTPRQLMTYIGTDVFKELNPDIWIRKCKAELFKGSRDVLVVPDIRFIDEFDSFKKDGFVMIKIKRYGLKEFDHISEGGLPDNLFDHVIENTFDNITDLTRYVLKNVLHENNNILFDLYRYIGKQFDYKGYWGKEHSVRVMPTNVAELHDNFMRDIWFVNLKPFGEFLFQSEKYPELVEEFSDLELEAIRDKFRITGSAVQCHNLLKADQLELLLDHGFDVLDLKHKYGQ